jgi:vancomycin resistance protein YoaR
MEKHVFGLTTKGCITAAFTIIIFAAVIIGSSAMSIANQERIIIGVASDGTKLTGMTRDEAADWFQKDAQQKLQANAISLHSPKQVYHITPQDIDLVADAEAAAAQAYAVGHDHGAVMNLLTQLRCIIWGQNIPQAAAYDHNKLDQKLAAIKQAVSRPPVNASCQIMPSGSIKHIKGATGCTLDLDELKDRLQPGLAALQLPIDQKLQLEKQEPSIHTQDLAAADAVLASYTTSYVPDRRGENIALAASKLSGVLIRSGEAFSFNETVGTRTAAAGYHNAGVIINGRLAQDVGGGVCQVSSTLYNAVLLAGLQATERTPHFYPSAYCPTGRDATVADGLLDFKFQNTLSHPVYLLTTAAGSSLTIYVVGTKADLEGDTITLQNEGPRLHPSVYRIWTRNGQVISREFLHTDSYSTP